MPKIVSTTKNILVVAGDSSGDLHGAGLIKALKERDPEIHVTAVGGRRIQKVSDKFIYDLVSIGAAGFSDPIRHFFLWAKLIRLIRKLMEERRPACMIAIDFYGFNHQILGLAAHREIPAYYYISPQVWATRSGRVSHIAKLVRHVITILPFEVDIYSKAGVPCTFVGHPLLDILPEPAPPPQGRNADYPWKIGILPGSRPGEIMRHLPLFLNTFKQIWEAFPKSTAHVFAVPEVSDDKLNALCRKDFPGAAGNIQSVEIVREQDYNKRAQMDFAFTSSGTATLENALLGIPMVVAYQLPWFTYQVAKRIIRVPYISLVNILSGREIVKEYIQKKANPHAISGHVLSLLQNPDKLEAQRKELLSLRQILGDKGASGRTADIILKSQPVFKHHSS